MATMRKVITNSELGTDMLGKGYVIGPTGDELGGLGIGYKDTKEICFGNRSGGKTGSGSWDDPYDAPTHAALDEMLADLDTDYKWVIRARDGEYMTKGAWNLRAGWSFFGEGVGRTILTYDPSDTFGQVSVMSGLIGSPGNCHVEGLTLDCNHGNLTQADNNSKIGGLVLYGSRNIIRNVLVKQAFGRFSTQVESFGVLIQGGATEDDFFIAYGNLMENVTAEDFLGDYGVGVTMAAGGSMVNCWARRYNIGEGFDPAASHVVGLGLSIGTMVGGGCHDCQVGVYGESVLNVSYIGQVMTEIEQIGYQFNPTAPTGQNIKVIGSNIAMRDDGTVVRAWGISFAGGCNRCEAIGNTIDLTVTGETPHDVSGNYGIIAATDLGLSHKAAFNTVAVAFKNQLAADSVVVGNRDFDGAEIPAGTSNGQGLRDIYLTEVPPIADNSIFGSLRSTAERTDPEGSWSFSLDIGPYVIASGDVLEVAIKFDSTSASFVANLQFATAGGPVGSNDVQDQNGLLLANADLTDYANGEFYSRTAALEDIVGENVTKFLIGGTATDSMGAPAGAGAVIHYVKNIRIVDADGLLQLDIFSDETLADAVIGLYSSADVADYPSMAATFLPIPFDMPPTTDPEVIGVIWNDAGTLKASAGP